MNTRYFSRWFWLALAVACFTIPFFTSKAATNKAATRPQGGTATPNVRTAGGLTVITFITKPGTITVNLPDEIMAGDTISGTVFTEPTGSTAEEKAKNQSVLNGTVLDLGGTKIHAERPTFSWTPQIQPTTPVRYQIRIVEVLGRPVPEGMTQSGAVVTPNPKTTPLTHPSGVITPDPKITPTFNIPPLGQTGRTIVITGPFDGNSSNTTLNAMAPRTSVQDFEKNTENVSGGFGLLAESPRKAVFQSPTNVTGQIEITLKDGDKQTTGNYRNVGVNLSAPKTSLLKGEKTDLKVEVSGLEGIKEPVPLTLECTGVITMQGGALQPLRIQPSEVGADGRYTTSRGITGVQAGGWGATATVVTRPFNVCFQDDSRAATMILWNTVSGDYSFRPPGGSSAPPTGGAPLTGKGTMVMKGCILTLQHNAPDRRVFARLDTCTSAGNAEVEMPATKAKFTITDRNIADNTCSGQ